MLELNKIYNEDCIETMAKMPDSFVDLTVTSPPYDNLRSYKNDIDKTWGEHVWKPIIEELYRITKEGGVVVWVVGDATIKGSETGVSFKQALYFNEVGFNIHDTMMYERSPSFPSSESRSNRYSQAFEYMFVLSKGKPGTVNLIADRKNRWGGCSSFGTQTERLKNGEKKIRGKTVVKEFGVRFNIWEYAKGKGFSSKDDIWDHPATFPEKLAEDHIISWSNENDIVYDPFVGSGTTAKMAVLNNRQYVASEISSEYCEIAVKRVGDTIKDKAQQQF